MVLLSPFTFYLSLSFAQDAQRLGERSIMGTARYVGMGGAMTAIGGDPSAALDNPAGLGLYRHHEVMLTLDDAIDNVYQRGTNLGGRTNLFMAPQASIVIHIPTGAVDGVGVQAHNFLFSYHRVQSYNRLYNVQGLEGIPSLGKLFASTRNLGYNDKNILIHGRRRFYTSPRYPLGEKYLEPVWHRATLDLMAALSLTGADRFVGTVVSYRAGHTLDCDAVRALYRNDLLTRL